VSLDVNAKFAVAKCLPTIWSAGYLFVAKRIIGLRVILPTTTQSLLEGILLMQQMCSCEKRCGEVPANEDHPLAVCKGLTIRKPPLVEIILVDKRQDVSTMGNGR
jgi:hypothetical protein